MYFFLSSLKIFLKSSKTKSFGQKVKKSEEEEMSIKE